MSWILAGVIATLAATGAILAWVIKKLTDRVNSATDRGVELNTKVLTLTMENASIVEQNKDLARAIEDVQESLKRSENARKEALAAIHQYIVTGRIDLSYWVRRYKELSDMSKTDSDGS